MTEFQEHSSAISKTHSLRFRILGISILFVLASTGALVIYTLSQFETATTLEIKHEGLLLSDTLEAIILPELAAGDIAQIQDQIDRLVANRDRNDVEINIIELQGDASFIIASNSPDNIDETDKDEHRNLLVALKNRTPRIFVSRDSGGYDPDDVEVDASHPDNYLAAGERFLSITTPLMHADRNLGGINLKLSLTPLDEELEKVRLTLAAAAGAEVLIIIIGLGLILSRQIFRPLKQLKTDMHHIEQGDLDRTIPESKHRNEITVLSHAFNSMASQLARTQAQLHQYLNPKAIEEAYRRARETGAEPLAEEREISVLFVDVVSFTTLSERLGPTNTVAFLNRFYDLMTVALIDTGGYIDKFVADEAVCVFDNMNHADRAVEAARQILHLLATAPDNEPLQVRIGINTGECIVADIGSQKTGRLDRTIIGDTVNVAQRLMTAAKPNTVLFSEYTKAALTRPVTGISPVGELQLKGKVDVVMAYQLEPEFADLLT